MVRVWVFFFWVLIKILMCLFLVFVEKERKVVIFGKLSCDYFGGYIFKCARILLLINICV